MWERKKKNPDAQKEQVLNKTASGIAKAINGIQSRFAGTLNKKTAHLSQQGKIILVIIFCIVFGGGSIYILIDGLRSQNSSQLLKSKSISVPKHIDRTGEKPSQMKSLITAENIKRIQQFRKYMDSLKTTGEGILIRDSILRARPGLMDSLTEVERLYHIDSAFKN